ncbi:MAG: hypothetical protein QM763_23935 [Agriterribacter sp.]
MKLVIIVRFCFIFILISWFNYCKKNYKPQVNVVLYDKPLSVIRQHIQGKWQLIYGKGGIATTTQYYDETFWEFNADSLRILKHNNAYLDTVIHWDYDLGTFTNGDSTYIMNFNDKLGYIYNYIVDKIYNDTLIVHDYAVDAYFYRLIKSN